VIFSTGITGTDTDHVKVHKDFTRTNYLIYIKSGNIAGKSRKLSTKSEKWNFHSQYWHCIRPWWQY